MVISYPEDKLASSIMAILRTQGIRVLHTLPGALGSRQITLQCNLLRIDGWTISGVLFRVSPESVFNEEFEVKDQAFCDAELRAIWLAAINLDSILAVNKYDAMAWFEGLSWPTWRRKLIQAQIPVAKFFFGDSELDTQCHWYPYASQEPRTAPGYITKRILGSALTESASTQASFMVGKEVIAGRRSDSILATVQFLVDSGIYIAEIVTDIDDNILSINTQPTTAEVHLRNLICGRIAELFHAHLYRG